MLGRAAKLLDYLKSDKKYRAGFKLGIKTDTGDITGNIINRFDCNIKKENILSIIPEFTGTQKQLPPMYSALKRDGVPLYSLARKGIEVERDYRDITIYGLQLLSYDEDEMYGEIEVHCTKGTYIRTLCEDIGEKLSCGGVMTSLLRTEAYGFKLSECIKLDVLKEAEASGNIEKFIISPEKVLYFYPEITVPDDGRKYYINGGFISERRFDRLLEGDIYRIYDSEGLFLGLGKKSGSDGECGIKSIWLP